MTSACSMNLSILPAFLAVITVHTCVYLDLISSLVFTVKVLNQAKLDASVRAYGSGTEKITNKWPSPYVLLCGVCLLVSLFEHFWRPLKWFALGAVAAGILPILQRSFAAARRLTLDVNILMLIAGKELPLVHRDNASFD